MKLQLYVISRFFLSTIVILNLSSTICSAEEQSPQAPYSLDECFLLAKHTNEKLKREAEDIHIAEAQYQQALANLYPGLDLRLNQNLRDNAEFGRVSQGGSSTEDANTASGGRGGSLGRSQFEGNLNLSQPIFNGFRDLIFAESLKHEAGALNLDLKRNQEILYGDVGDLYYQVLRTQAELKILGRSSKTIAQRIKELEKFRQLGKSRDSEVNAAVFDLEDLKALEGRTIGLLKISIELLAYLLGIPAQDLALNSNPKKISILPLSDYLTKIADRLDLKAAHLRTIAQKERLKIAERGKWPQVDLFGNAYAYEDPDRNREWDLLIQLSLPIFDGGLTKSRTAEEQARLRSSELFSLEVKRQAERDVRTAYQQALTNFDQTKQLQKLLSAAQRSYQSQRADYEFGVVSNLEVLQSIRQVQETERRLAFAEYEYLNSIVKLEVAAGSFYE